METSRPLKVGFMAVLVLFFGLSVFGLSTVIAESAKKDLTILQAWSGDYPVAEIGRLPAEQQEGPAGYIGDPATFASVWQVFKPGEKIPEMDFEKNIVVFGRNVNFYNRTSIAKVFIENGGVEILAIETRSAMPIEGKVAMAMAIIPREGVEFIRSADKRIPVRGR